MTKSPNGATVVRAAFGRCVELRREFLTTYERCALKGWPDRRAPLRTAFRLQELFVERDILRFDYLATTYALEARLWQSLSSITDISRRINEAWTEAYEQALKG